MYEEKIHYSSGIPSKNPDDYELLKTFKSFNSLKKWVKENYKFDLNKVDFEDSSKRDIYGDHIGKDVIFGIRPEDLHDPSFIPPGVENQSLIQAKVDVMEMMGNEVFVYLQAGNRSMIARVDPRTDFKVGDNIQVSGNTDNLHLFDKTTETAIR